MKKVLVVLAVVLMFSASVVASPAELIGLGGLPYQLTNLEENAIANPALLGDSANKAVIGIELNALSLANIQAEGMAIINMGPGTLLVGAGARTMGGVDILNNTSWSYDIPNSSFNLGYAMDVADGVKAGLSVGYGVDNYFEKSIWSLGTEIDGKSEYSLNSTLLRIAAGAALDVGMPLELGVSVNLPAGGEIYKYLGADEAYEGEDVYTYSGMDLSVDARTKMDDVTLALNVSLLSIKSETIEKWEDPKANYMEKYEDSSLRASLLVGKEIKATDNLKVNLATGLKLKTDSAWTGMEEDFVAETTDKYNNDVSGGMTLTVPFTLAVTADLGKLWTISNDKLTATIGITKEAIVLNSYNSKSVVDIDADELETFNQTDYSELSNVAPVTGAVGVKWQLQDMAFCIAAGAEYNEVADTILPKFAANWVFNWK